MISLIKVYADVDKKRFIVNINVSESTDITDKIESENMLGTSISNANKYVLTNDSDPIIAYAVKGEKDINYPVIFQDTHNTEAIIKGDCVICKQKSGVNVGLSSEERDVFVAKIEQSQTKLQEINAKAEKAGVECMKKLYEES